MTKFFPYILLFSLFGCGSFSKLRNSSQDFPQIKDQNCIIEAIHSVPTVELRSFNTLSEDRGEYRNKGTPKFIYHYVFRESPDRGALVEIYKNEYDNYYRYAKLDDDSRVKAQTIMNDVDKAIQDTCKIKFQVTK
jgi:hypothetical protein